MPDARPILKWAGGKGQLLDRLQPLFPPKFNRYIEPFAGAGAVFFRLYNLGLIGANPRLRTVPAILNDCNGELMTVYQAVRDHLDELIDELARHQAHVTDPDYYYAIRNLDREPDFWQWPLPVRAARTIFLNKTGYNGLYRVNQSGYFNVPFGRYTHPTVLDRDVLKAAHQALQCVDLMCSDFAQPLRLARKRDFIYIDPPYQPTSRTANFTAYTARGFGWSEQERLAKWLARVARRGCYVLINNADTPQVRELYHAAFAERGVLIRMVSFETARNINSAPDARGGGQELTVWNY
jgi:DNA adenine methylase